MGGDWSVIMIGRFYDQHAAGTSPNFLRPSYRAWAVTACPATTGSILAGSAAIRSERHFQFTQLDKPRTITARAKEKEN